MNLQTHILQCLLVKAVSEMHYVVTKTCIVYGSSDPRSIYWLDLVAKKAARGVDYMLQATKTLFEIHIK